MRRSTELALTAAAGAIGGAIAASLVGASLLLAVPAALGVLAVAVALRPRQLPPAMGVDRPRIAPQPDDHVALQPDHRAAG